MISEETLALVLAELENEDEQEFLEEFAMFVFDILTAKEVSKYTCIMPIVNASIDISLGDLVKKEDEVLH